MIWPIWSGLQYFLGTPLGPARVSIRTTAVSAKSDGDASSRTVGWPSSNTASSASGVRAHGAPRASPRSAYVLLLQGKAAHPTSPRVCIGKNQKWRRLHQNDVCTLGRGKRGHFDGIECLELSPLRAARYEERIQSQTCGRAGCSELKSGDWGNDQQVRLCPFRLERDDQTKNLDGAATPLVSSGRSQSASISIDPNPCEQPIRRSVKGIRQSCMDDGLSGCVLHGGSPPLTRAKHR